MQSSSGVDRLCGWTKATSFNVKVAYEFFRLRDAKVVWADTIWNISIIPKHAFIHWLGVKSRLLTKDKIQNLELDGRCSFCGEMEEIALHLFFSYPFSSSI